MIPMGSSRETTPSTPERSAEFREEYAQELGLIGLSASMDDEEVVGYPANVDGEGNYIITPQATEVPARELKPGDIGYNPLLDGKKPETYHIPGSDTPGSAGGRNE